MSQRDGFARVEDVATTATAQTWAMGPHPLPGTLWVRPTSGNTFTVDYSTDNGANYQTLTALNAAAAYAETVVNAGFTTLKITPSGVQGGEWGIC